MNPSRAAGASLGPYQLGPAIGAGGMGEVYHARDPRLGRDVAIKILPPEVADDPDRLRRFEQEARAAAALNHPNILSVHDVGTDNAVAYLVTELLDGKTLREEIIGANGGRAFRPGMIAGSEDPASIRSLGIDRALGYAGQIADGLAAAHARGIVHRDLKPENVFVTTDGRVKILDFGLAKVLTDELGGDLTKIASELNTDSGVILGTVGYMAPEQIRGQAVDPRTDIFAFGCVLYEMLAGRRAFEGETPFDTLSAILKDTPAPLASHASNGAIAPPLARIVERCLEKVPAARFQSAADLAFALRASSEFGAAKRSADSAVPAHAAAQRWRRALPWAVAAAGAAAGALAWWAPATVVDPAARPVVRLTLPIAESLVVSYGIAPFALSPDGSRLIYLAHDADPTPRVFLRRLDEDRAAPIAHTEMANTGLTFSPDSRWIAYNAGQRKFKVPVDGGLPVLLAPLGGHFTAWGRNHTLVFSAPTHLGINLGSLWRIPASGGEPSLIAEPIVSTGERAYYAPSLLPDGSILFVTVRPGSSALAILPKGLLPARTLIEGVRQARFVEPGYLLVARGTTLLAAPFDLRSLSVTGPPVPVLEGVRPMGSRISAFSLSDNVTLVYLPGAGQAPVERVLSLTDRRTGRETTMPFTPAVYSAARFAPDGQAVAIGIEQVDGELTTTSLWLGDPVRGSLTRLAADGSRFAWTSDGRHVAFQMSDGSVAWRDRQLGGPAQPLVPATQMGGVIEGGMTWGPDGGLIFAAIRTQANGSDLWMARGVTSADEARGREPIVALIEEPGNQTHPAASPDASWLAYHDWLDPERGGTIRVRALTGSPSLQPVVANASGPIRWVGGELFFVRQNTVMAVAIATSPSLDIGTPREVLTIPPGAIFADVTPDGQQILLLKRASEPVPEPALREFRVIINFVEEMKRKVAAGR